MAKHPPYLFKKRGIYYFQKRVPHLLVPAVGKSVITKSMLTADKSLAVRTAGQLLTHLERQWHKQLFSFDETVCILKQLDRPSVDVPLMSQAIALYIDMKGKSNNRKFLNPINYATGLLIQLCGDKLITAYSRTDALRLRDFISSKDVTSSTLKRNIGVVSSIWNFAAKEHGITYPNPFVSMHLNKSRPSQKRRSIPIENIRTIQEVCFEMDDDIRWLVALLSDTGMRLAEAAGLAISDLHLDAEIPFVRLSEHRWRRLKTKGSQRDIPLVGASLWAANRVVEMATNDFAFPRYCSSEGCKADYASNTLNKWLRRYVPEGCVVHSLRHSMRDRLRAVQCPADIIDQIGGWKTSGVGQAYGQGYELNALHKWLNKT